MQRRAARPYTDLDIEVGEVPLVDEHQALEEVPHEADDVALVRHLIVIQDSLQVTAASPGTEILDVRILQDGGGGTRIER